MQGEHCWWEHQAAEVLFCVKKISMLQESHRFSCLLPLCFLKARQCIGYSFILG